MEILCHRMGLTQQPAEFRQWRKQATLNLPWVGQSQPHARGFHKKQGPSSLPPSTRPRLTPCVNTSDPDLIIGPYVFPDRSLLCLTGSKFWVGNCASCGGYRKDRWKGWPCPLTLQSTGIAQSSLSSVKAAKGPSLNTCTRHLPCSLT